MTKILFVCHGNICRSPMAEFIFKHLAEKQGRAEEFFVSSCATSTEEIWNGIGNPVYPPAAEQLRIHGISCAGKRAVQLRKSDYEKYDMFICMDGQNISNALRILGGDPQCKLSKLMEHTPFGGDVSDPWYSGDFETAYSDILKGCEALLEKL